MAFAKRVLPILACLSISPWLAAQESTSPNIRFGMPSPAKADPSHKEDYLIERAQYVLSYNNKTKTPNWVCWCLKKEDIGKSQRGAFKQDGTLPAGFTQITSTVYNDSGFDRGHMCPAQDRSSHQKDMDATFFLTNVVPQSPDSNQHAWERLESYCRSLARDHVLYICCGPHGVGGVGKNGKADVIGKGKMQVTVPAKLWKVILVMPNEAAGPRKNTRAIAIIMPNNQEVGYDWAKHRVSVREVEKLTGFTFFPKIDAEIAHEIKKDADEVQVRVPAEQHRRKGKDRSDE